MKCLWQVEIDDYANRVLEKHWPNVPRWRDVRTFPQPGFERPDVICGGFPCQDISYAGRGAGLNGERSGLFFEAVRVVRELQPRFVVLENVAGLLTRGLDRVLGTLAEVGYDAEWHCISAAAIGAPHIRDRVFIMAYSNIAGRQTQRICEKWPWSSDEVKLRCYTNANSIIGGKEGSGLRKKKSARRRSRSRPTDVCNDVPSANIAGLEGEESKRQRSEQSGLLAECNWWDVEPNVGRVANGVPNRVDRLRTIGNAVVPKIAEWIGRRIVESDGVTG